jgi:alpha-beta hydrolase superfamily lysophospholipase
MQTIETRIRHITAAMTVTLLTAMSTELVAADEKAPQVNRGYAPVNGLKMYYELHGVDGGKNPPLVLLHGGGSTIDTTFGKVLPSLAKSRQVVAFEQQGHGRTGDMADRPFSFEQSADDTVALMDHLKIEKADLFGFSNGGNIALQIAIRHPNRVRKLVVASAMFKRDGLYPEVWEFMKRSTLEDMPKELKEAYLKVSPHPEQLPTFHDKSAKRHRCPKPNQVKLPCCLISLKIGQVCSSKISTLAISMRSWHSTNRMPASWPDPAKPLSAATGFETR